MNWAWSAYSRQQRRETADVGVVEGGLDLVQEVERARPREEEGEEERNRAESLLAAREQREPRDTFAGGSELDLDAGLFTVVLGLGEPQPALAAREEALDHLREVELDRSEGLLEALRDRLGEVAAEGLELGEALLEVGTLRRELVEALLLCLVLLLGQRVDLAELLAAALQAVEPRRELVTVVALRRLRSGGVEPPLGLLAVGVDPRQLDLEGARALGSGREQPTELDLFGAETAQRGAQLRAAGRVGVDALPEECLEWRRVDREGPLEAAGLRGEALEEHDVDAALRPDVGQRPRGGVRPLGSGALGLGGGARLAGALARLPAQRLRVAGGRRCRAASGEPLGLAGTSFDLSRLAAEPRVARRKLGQLLRRGRGPCGQRLLDPGGDRGSDAKRLVEALRPASDPLESVGIGPPNTTQVRERRERIGCVSPARGSGCGGNLGSARGLLELLDLGGVLAAPGLELQKQRLCRRAGEPELTATRVPADAVARHGGDGRGQELPGLDDRQALHDPARVAPHEDDQRPEPGGLGLPDELEPARGIVDDQARAEPAERGCDSELGAGLGLDRREHEPLAALGERSGGRRKPFALRERPVEGSETLPRELGAGAQVVALACCGAGSAIGLLGGVAELVGRRARRHPAPGLRQLGRDVDAEPGRRLLEQPDPAACAAQRDEPSRAAPDQLVLVRRALAGKALDRRGRRREVGALGARRPRPGLGRGDLGAGAGSGRGLGGG